MEYKKFNDKYVLRLDKNEEIITKIKELCAVEDIKLGTITGLGATNEVTVGLFDPTTKQYQSTTLKDNFEIVSLVGNISTMNNETYLHLHIAVSNSKYETFGGHLNSALISATGEITITKIEGSVERELSEEIGLNLYKFI